ncbi:hypothetical protein LTR36_009420 [Oleoguttula mirabilis]|uniref:Uncharacterized protein n=1 Tax=Oleoguttula mirabilis TaxID=1507867 RepID=A0AAV9JSX3_9PEZI|nr:hypothetical protein LTR36_009420 [Oleoguttula mirabilis]
MEFGYPPLDLAATNGTRNGTYTTPTTSDIKHAGRELYTYLAIAAAALMLALLLITILALSRSLESCIASTPTRSTAVCLAALLLIGMSSAVHWSLVHIYTLPGFGAFRVSYTATYWLIGLGVTGLSLNVMAVTFWIMTLGHAVADLVHGESKCSAETAPPPAYAASPAVDGQAKFDGAGAGGAAWTHARTTAV